MQKTTIVNSFGFPIFNQPQLIVATMDSCGRVDTSSIQPLCDWNNGIRNSEIVAKVHGYELVDILANELGMVDVDETGYLKSKIFITQDPHISVMRLLGKVAEALIVNKCTDDINKNRIWGMHARKGKRPHKSIDQFRAVGTGLNSTQRLFPTKYDPTDPQRDIIWINKENPKEELLQLTLSNNSAIPAGVQVKVSRDGFKYIYRTDVARGKYEVPLVYFDLSNDYYKLTNAIYQEMNQVEIGVDIVRGRDIDIECHEMLVSYYYLVLELVTGKMTMDQLINNDILFESFKKEVQEQCGKKVITV